MRGSYGNGVAASVMGKNPECPATSLALISVAARGCRPFHSLVTAIFSDCARGAVASAQRGGGLPLLEIVFRFVFAVLILCVLLVAAGLYLINFPSSKVPDFQPVDQHVYLSQGLGWTGAQNN